nr:hypothetical protein [Fimbriiglobus ruber]
MILYRHLVPAGRDEPLGQPAGGRVGRLEPDRARVADPDRHPVESDRAAHRHGAAPATPRGQDSRQATTRQPQTYQTNSERGRATDARSIQAGTFIAKPFTEYAEADFAGILSVNLVGFFHVTQRALPRCSCGAAAAS